MDWHQTFDSFQLKHNLIIDNNVKAIAALSRTDLYTTGNGTSL